MFRRDFRDYRLRLYIKRLQPPRFSVETFVTVCRSDWCFAVAFSDMETDVKSVSREKRSNCSMALMQSTTFGAGSSACAAMGSTKRTSAARDQRSARNKGNSLIQLTSL